MQEHKENKNLVEQGFTLIELLIVIAILGVLAGVVVFAVGGITDRGKNSACKTEVKTVQTAIEAFNAKTSAYPTDVSAPAGLDWGDLNDTMGPGTTNKFLNEKLSATSPSVAAGYDYNAGGDYSSATGCPS